MSATLLVTPDGARMVLAPRVDTAMVEAAARVDLRRPWAWREPNHVSRILRLTLLVPEIVEAILDGRQPAELQVDDLAKGFPSEWEEQRKSLAINSPSIPAL